MFFLVSHYVDSSLLTACSYRPLILRSQIFQPILHPVLNEKPTELYHCTEDDKRKNESTRNMITVTLSDPLVPTPSEEYPNQDAHRGLQGKHD